MFCHINRDLLPNQDINPHIKDPISIKNIKQGDMAWSTRKVILGWYIYTAKHQLKLPSKRENKVRDYLVAIPWATQKLSFCKWWCLLGITRRITPEVVREKYMFTHIQKYFTRDRVRYITLPTIVYENYTNWRSLIDDLYKILTHLREL